jgi:nucleotide-binding universal stress UspA family protein/quercetin dioxygenase-like cupin family protein
MPHIPTILHPTDFSENSLPAFQTACSLARDSHATLIVLHVMMPSVSPLTEVSPPDPLHPAGDQGAHADLPWPRPSDPQIRVEHRLAEGDPPGEILRLTEALRCDLVVMGTHGRTGLGRFLTGSVAEEVLRRALCPVLVVKTPLRPRPAAEAEVTTSAGEPIDVQPLGAALASAQTRTLVHTTDVDVVRLIVQAGQEVMQPRSEAETLMHCLEGRVALTALGKTRRLDAGTMLHLPTGEPCAILGIEDSSLLLTTLAPRR